jgi:NAD(P)H-dependent FMN reductase
VKSPIANTMITILSGTNRPGANTRKVAGQVFDLYQSLGAEATLLDLAQLPPVIFDPSSYEKTPPSFQPFADAIVNCAGLVIVTPEYNGGFPGVLKYFIDMLPFPESFEGRPVCFIGLAAGMWGAIRPIEQLQAIWTYRSAHPFPTRVFLPGIKKLLSEEGRLTDEKIVHRLRDQATGFIEFVKRIRMK